MIKDKIHIYRAIIILLGIFAFGPLWSQQSKVQNLITFDDKPYHFGYLLGANQMLFIVKTNANSFKVETNLGFTVGLISDLRLGEYFNLRLLPNLQFGERTLIYPSEDPLKLSSVLLNIPLNLKIKGKRMHNIRPYVLVGGSLSTDVGGNARNNNNDNKNDFLLYRNDVYIDTGVGFDFYFNWFKMSTELKMSYGLSEMFLSGGINNPWADSWIDGLKSKVFQFNITIE
ncbi:MAG: outer membrane beta-barrel protein [Bacteroidales bacterium]|nr:outer membrane beta-barrel protein [Bacteroidales bacterium]